MDKEQSAINIIEGLINGSITITRMEDFRKILAQYPDNPFVNRLVADFLKKGNSFPNAIKRYKKTYGLFMAYGETLHAIAALLELWEIVTPAPRISATCIRSSTAAPLIIRPWTSASPPCPTRNCGT